MMSKKFVSMLFASTLLLAACGDDGGSVEDTSTAEEVGTEEVAEEEVEPEETAEESDSAEAEETSSDNEIILGQPIEFETFTVTITGYETTTDYDGNPMLVYTYDWVNTGEETQSPFMTFSVTGFQNGVSTESTPFSDTVDYGSGQVEVRPEGAVEGAQDAIGLTSAEEPVELELTEVFSFDNNAYTTTINPADYQ